MTRTKAPKVTTAKHRLIASAQELMLERGYADTTVDEICAHAEVSKGSFYHFFSTKEEMGLAALENYYEAGIKRVMDGPFMQETDPKRRLLGFLLATEARSEEFWGAGCLLGTFAIDLANTHPSIRDRVGEQFKRITQRFSPFFEPIAGPDGQPPTAEDLAESYLGTIEGAIVLARAFNDPSRIRQRLEAFRLQLGLATD